MSLCDGTIRTNVATETLHELPNPDIRLAPFAVDHFDRFHMRIKLLWLTGPVGTNLFVPRGAGFDLAGTTKTEGAPSFAHFARGGSQTVRTTECIVLIIRPAAYLPFQGSKISTPHPSKSARLRVASLAPCRRAMDAICASAWLIGFPSVRRRAAICAKTRAASLSNPKTRPAKSSANIASAAASNPSWR